MTKVYCNLKKEKIPAKPKHLEFIRTLPCCKCGVGYQIVAHHILRTKEHLHGMSKKCPDTKVVPMCNDEHNELHGQKGNELNFFNGYPLEPLADKLYNNTGNYVLCLQFVNSFRSIISKQED